MFEYLDKNLALAKSQNLRYLTSSRRPLTLQHSPIVPCHLTSPPLPSPSEILYLINPPTQPRRLCPVLTVANLTSRFALSFPPVPSPANTLQMSSQAKSNPNPLTSPPLANSALRVIPSLFPLVRRCSSSHPTLAFLIDSYVRMYPRAPPSQRRSGSTISLDDLLGRWDVVA